MSVRLEGLKRDNGLLDDCVITVSCSALLTTAKAAALYDLRHKIEICVIRLSAVSGVKVFMTFLLKESFRLRVNT